MFCRPFEFAKKYQPALCLQPVKTFKSKNVKAIEICFIKFQFYKLRKVLCECISERPVQQVLHLIAP